MSVAVDKIIALFIMCFGVYGLWTAVTGLQTGKMKHFGMPIFKLEHPKRFFIEIIGRFLAGLLFIVMGLFFAI